MEKCKGISKRFVYAVYWNADCKCVADDCKLSVIPDDCSEPECRAEKFDLMVVYDIVSS